jgi:F420-dependent oxidoreductase-like protein
MRLGLVLGEGARDLNGLVQQAVDCEQDGFDSGWWNQVMATDALTLIALAGQRTSRMELGTAVIPVYTQHPVAMAQQALTAQAASGGRLALGIGLSHKPVVEGMWGLSYDKPAGYMREYLAALTPLLDEGKVAFQGERFRVSAGVRVPGASRVPVLVAALAPKMLRIAGSSADGTVLWMTGVKTIETHIVPRINAAAESAGRARPRVVASLPVAVTDDVDGAREKAGSAFRIYGQLPNYRRMLDIEGAAGPADVAIIGNEQAVEQQLRAVASAGATEFAAAILPAGDDARASVARTRALLKSLIGRI